MRHIRLMCLALVLQLVLAAAAQAGTLPDGFVYLKDVSPAILQDLRYYGEDNFVGARVDGYNAPTVILTRQAAEALHRVQVQLQAFGLGLLVFDGYRPQRAVDHFQRWAKDLQDTKTKERYYPDVPKEELFKRGYIAARSSHSRGSTVDLTIISLEDGQPLDMGSPFDFFGPISWPASMDVQAPQRAHRMLLQRLMVSQGFVPYDQEWWHFTLKGEPFPDTFFDFPVE
ncbi:M15 family metallopeptidase [Megalodesulfovibrio paquesii]